jgi:hypothetical protein
MCQQRQREHYHKCFTCVHNNARGETAKVTEALTMARQPASQRGG